MTCHKMAAKADTKLESQFCVVFTYTYEEKLSTTVQSAQYSTHAQNIIGL